MTERVTNPEPCNQPNGGHPLFSPDGTLVTFIISPIETAQEFKVHKEFACHYSPILNAAFHSSFVEGQSQTYKLENTSIRAFQFLLKDDDEIEGDPRCELAPSEEDMAPVELWVLADKLCMLKLQNCAITKLAAINELCECAGSSITKYVCSNTGDGSLLRAFIVRQCVRYFGPGDFSYPQPRVMETGFLLDIAAESMQLLKYTEIDTSANAFFVKEIVKEKKS